MWPIYFLTQSYFIALQIGMMSSPKVSSLISLRLIICPPPFKNLFFTVLKPILPMGFRSPWESFGMPKWLLIATCSRSPKSKMETRHAMVSPLQKNGQKTASSTTSTTGSAAEPVKHKDAQIRPLTTKSCAIIIVPSITTATTAIAAAEAKSKES